MSSKNYAHTMHYTYIDEALRARWNNFVALEREMAEFVPKPVEEFQAKREADVERLRVLNPEAPVAELAAFVDRQIDFFSSRDWQFLERFEQRHMTEYVTVVMLSHALSEALIRYPGYRASAC